MILAAGRGTRLGAVGALVPKVLLEIGGRTLLERHLEYLERERVTRVVINAHHRSEQVEAFAAAYSGPLELIVVVEPTLLGTAGAVRNALRHLGHNPFFVLYGDVLIDEPLEPIATAHRTSSAMATLTVYEAPSTAGKGVVEADVSGRVLRFAEKQQDGRGLVNAGLYVLEPRLIERLPPGVPFDFGHDVLPAAVAAGEHVVAYPLHAAALDVGTPEALEAARMGVGGSSFATPGAQR